MVQAVQCTDRAKSLECRDQLVLPKLQRSVETCSTSSQMPVQERSSVLKHSHKVHGACIYTIHQMYKCPQNYSRSGPLQSGGLVNNNIGAFALTRQMDIHVGLGWKRNGIYIHILIFVFTSAAKYNKIGTCITDETTKKIGLEMIGPVESILRRYTGFLLPAGSCVGRLGT